MSDWHDEDVLVTVRAYPEPSKKYMETSCVAGVTREGKPRRLYPIPYRMLAKENQFKKYDVVRMRTKKSDEVRPESHKVDLDRPFPILDHLGTDDGWQERDLWVESLRAPSMESLIVTDVRTSRSLALVRPRKVERLVIEATEANWGEREKAKLGQESMLIARPAASLERIPYRFSYQFRCDDSACNGHTMSVIDWEMHQSFRRWRDKYGDQWHVKFRQQYEQRLLERDLQFYVGTISSHMKTWLIIGLYYPPKGRVSGSKMTNLQLPLIA